MTIPYRVITTNGYTLVESGAQTYAEEDLCDALWLVQKELRHGLPKNEQIIAGRQIAHYQAMLDALRSAGA